MTATQGRCSMPTAYSNYVMREVARVEFIFRVLAASPEELETLLQNDAQKAEIERIYALKATSADALAGPGAGTQ